MANRGGKRKGSGPKTKETKGLKKHKQLSITIPYDTYLKLVSIQNDKSMSTTITDILELAFQKVIS